MSGLFFCAFFKTASASSSFPVLIKLSRCSSELVKRSIEYASENSYELLFVRTPTTNIPAFNLYEKFGFEKSVNVEAEKIKKDKSGKFIEIKQYLIKNFS